MPPSSPLASPSLKFRADGTFKFVHLTDLHFTTGASASYSDITEAEALWPCSDLNTTELIDEMLDLEDPDLVVFTGDTIYGSDAEPISPWRWRSRRSSRAATHGRRCSATTTARARPTARR